MEALLSLTRKQDASSAPPLLPLGGPGLLAAPSLVGSLGGAGPAVVPQGLLPYAQAAAAAAASYAFGRPSDTDEDDMDDDVTGRKRRKAAAIGTAGYHMFLQDLYAGVIPGILKPAGIDARAAANAWHNLEPDVRDKYHTQASTTAKPDNPRVKPVRLRKQLGRIRKLMTQVFQEHGIPSLMLTTDVRGSAQIYFAGDVANKFAQTKDLVTQYQRFLSRDDGVGDELLSAISGQQLQSLVQNALNGAWARSTSQMHVPWSKGSLVGRSWVFRIKSGTYTLSDIPDTLPTFPSRGLSKLARKQLEDLAKRRRGFEFKLTPGPEAPGLPVPV